MGLYWALSGVRHSWRPHDGISFKEAHMKACSFLCFPWPPSSLYPTSTYTGVDRQAGGRAGGRVIFPYSRDAAHMSLFELSVPRMVPDYEIQL